jgi:hypothetical protein
VRSIHLRVTDVLQLKVRKASRGIENAAPRASVH